ncbi:MAG: glycerophosphodiester phosphodiesterase [Oscillospiraceae bacterium]|nr:glycerophosphodiester phosphodiesterase [Oscillospiraceae bacterium]
MKPITKELFKSGTKPDIPVITAHSGCEGTPDNSMEHIRAAIDSGAEMLEIDIRKYGDTLYLTHNEQADLAGCATLAECFMLVAPHDGLCVNCDVKTFGLTADVCRLAKEYGMESRIVFTGSVGEDELDALAGSEADWWLSLWHSDHEAEDFTAACARYAAMGDLYRIINLDGTMVNDALLAEAETNGYALSVWTINREEDIRRAMAAGVANITTRCPKLALSIRKELFGR